jgi:type II secretory pathway component PulM
MEKSMNAKKAYYVFIAILALCILGVFVTIYIGNGIMQKSSSKLVQTKLEDISADTKEQTYLQARKNLEEYSSLNETISQILPSTKDQAQAVKNLYQIGDANGIIVSDIQFPTSTLGESSSSESVTQAEKVKDMPGVLGIDINVKLKSVSGDTINYGDLIKFLQEVELNRRSMQIKQITVNADQERGGVQAQLTLTIFVKP